MGLPGIATILEVVRARALFVLSTLALGCLFAAVHSCARAELAEHALAAERERVTLRARGVPTESPESAETMKRQLAQAQEESATFRKALQDLQAKVPGAKVVEVVRYVTAPAGIPPPHRPARDVGAPPPVSNGAAPCLLAQDDLGEIEVTEARLETKDGNRIPIAAARCIRASRERLTLFEGSLEMTGLSIASMEEHPPPVQAPSHPSYGVGVAGSCAVLAGKAACGAGPAVSFPLFWRLEGGGAVTVGGYTQGFLSLLVRM